MARPVWRGSITFGLVTIPVELYSATQDHAFHFSQYERGTSDRIRYRRVNERTGKEVDYHDIVKGYEFDDGELVLVDQDELARIAPGRSRTIDIDAFVDLAEIDPVYFQKSYWLAPASSEHRRAYALLLRAMEQSGRAGIARFVMRAKEYVAALRAGDSVLALDTLLFADEVRQPDVEDPADGVTVRDNEVKMATSLIDSMAASWRPEDYGDTYTARVRELLDEKKAGRTVEPAGEPAQPTEVVDLFEALSRSVQNRDSRGSGSQKSGKEGKKRKSGKRERAQEANAVTRDYRELTKQQLESMARDLEVRGRSKLNRAQLAEAVAEAEANEGGREAS